MRNFKGCYTKCCPLFDKVYPDLQVNPKAIEFKPEGETVNVSVTVSGTSNTDYEILYLPAWLTVSDKNKFGFVLSAAENLDPYGIPHRDVVITVKLIHFDIFKTVSIVQRRMVPLLEVDIDLSLQASTGFPQPNTIGLSLPVNASIDWGDSTPVTHYDLHRAMQTHTYPDAGKYTMKIFEIIDIPNDMLRESDLYFPAIVTNFRMNNGCKSIGNNAFSGQTHLGEVKLSENLVSIGTTAFYHASGLASDIVFRKLNTLAFAVFEGTSIRTVMFEETCPITLIDYNMFKNCKMLTAVKLSSKITSIGKECFNGCSGLKTIEMPSVTYLGDSAFNGTTSLFQDIVFDTLDYLGSASFNNSGIKSFKVSKLSRSGQPVALGGNFASLQTMGSNLYFGDEDSGNNIDIQSFHDVLSNNSSRTNTFWYYGNVLFHHASSFQYVSAAFRIYMKKAVIDQYDSVNYPEWTGLMSKVIAI